MLPSAPEQSFDGVSASLERAAGRLVWLDAQEQPIGDNNYSHREKAIHLHCRWYSVSRSLPRLIPASWVRRPKPIATSTVAKQQLNVLPLDYQLHWYRLERVLGQGGFGITYLARDTNLDQLVAIKEYLPVECAARASDITVEPRSENHREDYEWGLKRFISEAKTLAKFDHPNIVRVYSVFEQNNTAYMVMRYEQGENLHSILSRRKTLDEDTLMAIVLPILDGLQEIHRAGFIHRDIKPDNIYVREDGTPVLLDFGSARQAVGGAETLTILIAPGYAPFEQYYSSSDEQGPWTDIYSLGATLYRAVAGVAPVDAIARSKGILGSTRDVLVPATEVGRARYSHRFLAAIDHALAFSEKARPQTIAEWKAELKGETRPATSAESDGAISTTIAHSHEARSEAQLLTSSARTSTSGRETVVSTAAAGQTELRGRTKAARGLPWLRVGAGIAIVVLLPLLGIFVWQQLGERSSGKQAVAPPIGQATPDHVREAERLQKLEEELALLKKQLEDDQRQLDEEQKQLDKQRKEDATKAQREQELREEQQRLEKERQRLAEEERKAADERQRQAEAARKRRAQISQLLDAAETDLSQDRLTTPAGDNALDTFKKVLELEPQNAKAEQGIDRVIARYIALTDQALGHREFDQAQAYLDKAASIRPGAANVAGVRTRLTKAKTAFAEEQRLAEKHKEVEVAARAPAPPIATQPSPGEQLARGMAAFNARNYREAFRTLKPLAEQDMIEAGYYVGVMYDTGQGVSRSDAEAFKWYRKAAEQGYGPAQNSLGVMYSTGRGVARNNVEALKWYRRAADQCNVDAQTNLARIYAQGQGVTQSDFQAYAWYDAAAEAGNQIAIQQRDLITKKLQPVELEHARKLSQRYSGRCKKG